MPINTSNSLLVTPHAAVIVWNYNDRVGLQGTSATARSAIQSTIISTVSCISIQTSKSKSSPVGMFQLVLAPTKNWVSLLTPGSWCAILMSNNPITQTQLQQADPNFVKMIGRIDSVRVDTQMDEDGARHTRYLVSGVDWGYIFSNILYIDNLIASNDQLDQGNTIALVVQNLMFSNGFSPQVQPIDDLLTALMGLFGATSTALTEYSKPINRIGKSVYDFQIPFQMSQYFKFIDGDDKINPSLKLSDLLSLQSGRLTALDTYTPTNEAVGFIDPVSLQGTNSFWQILTENSNPALNEMFVEIDWQKNNTGAVGPSLTIFNRIKPFSYRSTANLQLVDPNAALTVNNIRSPFNLIKYHMIEDIIVQSVNVGTNWKDKVNFVEVRLQFSDLRILDNATLTKTQGADEAAFDREGFRPLIFGTKQYPTISSNNSTFDSSKLPMWRLLKEWYFDTHKMLNGTIILHGSTEYLGVGNNIMFNANLVNPTNNFNRGQGLPNASQAYILAHIESVDHNFTVSPDGARSYSTTVQFVRGLIVDQARNIIGSGTLDEFVSAQNSNAYNNTIDTFGMSDGILDATHPIDPNPHKLTGNL